MNKIKNKKNKNPIWRRLRYVTLLYITIIKKNIIKIIEKLRNLININDIC